MIASIFRHSECFVCFRCCSRGRGMQMRKNKFTGPITLNRIIEISLDYANDPCLWRPCVNML